MPRGTGGPRGGQRRGGNRFRPNRDEQPRCKYFKIFSSFIFLPSLFKLRHQIKANNHHHLNNMMTNKVHIEVDNVVVVAVVIIVVLIVAFVKVVQMLIQMHQHLIIQMIFPLFQNSKMVKLT
jgi:hypothetical protein